MVTMEPARATDAPLLLGLRDAAADWMADRGIRQWTRGEVTLDVVAASVERGEYFVARSAAGISGALRLLWEDPDVWGEQAADAGYVHSLAVGRDSAGQGLGRAMLDWAGRRVVAEGRVLLRLDCVAGNNALRDYYDRIGFAEVGIAQTHYGPVVLWQRSYG